MQKVSLGDAIEAAKAGWNAALHPRGRDGRFIEVGDTVAIFEGPGGPQVATGIVKGGHYMPMPDGRMFIAVETPEGETKWVRPKQIEVLTVKAKLPDGSDKTPKGPIPDVGAKGIDFELVDYKGDYVSPEHAGAIVKGEAPMPAPPVDATPSLFPPQDVPNPVGDPVFPPSAPATPSAPPAPAAVKLPGGKSPADVLGSIVTSAENKEGQGVSPKVVQIYLDEALSNPNPIEAHKSLAKAMTAAKLGGKQRARYKKILDMHLGVESTDEEIVGGKPIPHHGSLPAIGPVPPGTKVLSLEAGRKNLTGDGDAAIMAAQRKGEIQVAIAKRMEDIPMADWIALTKSPNFTPPSGFKNLAGRFRDFPVGSKMVLSKNPSGDWKLAPSTMTTAADALPDTAENRLLAMRETAVSSLVHLWAMTSNDANPRALAMQEAIAAEFGLQDYKEWEGLTTTKAAQVEDETKRFSPLFRRFLREMYGNTQEQLKAAGITHIRLRRGMTLLQKPGVVGSWSQVALRPGNSFTSHPPTSLKFGTTVIEADVPIERILGSARTGFGCLSEYEYVVLGGTDSYRLVQ